MKVVMQLVDTGATQAVLEVTMSLWDWHALNAQLLEAQVVADDGLGGMSSSRRLASLAAVWPASELHDAIRDLLQQVDKTFWPERKQSGSIVGAEVKSGV